MFSILIQNCLAPGILYAKLGYRVEFVYHTNERGGKLPIKLSFPNAFTLLNQHLSRNRLVYSFTGFQTTIHSRFFQSFVYYNETHVVFTQFNLPVTVIANTVFSCFYSYHI